MMKSIKVLVLCLATTCLLSSCAYFAMTPIGLLINYHKTKNDTNNEKMKIAVMDFRDGVGVNRSEVDGLSDMLINTMFKTGKFEIIERTQLNQVLKEQKLQGELTTQQLAKVGRILGVESILVGTVNYVRGEYNIDVRAVDVETAMIVTTAGASKKSMSSYRKMMEKIGKQLAKNLLNNKNQ